MGLFKSHARYSSGVCTGEVNPFKAQVVSIRGRLRKRDLKHVKTLVASPAWLLESSQAQALSKVFYAHQDKTLFILDGLDEVVGELNEGRPLKDFLQTLLKRVWTSCRAGT